MKRRMKTSEKRQAYIACPEAFQCCDISKTFLRCCLCHNRYSIVPYLSSRARLIFKTFFISSKSRRTTTQIHLVLLFHIIHCIKNFDKRKDLKLVSGLRDGEPARLGG